MVDWAYFPRSQPVPQIGMRLVRCFEEVGGKISSASNDHLIGKEFKEGASNVVLGHLRPGLERIGFQVERDKTSSGKISVPVLFGRGGRPDKSFDADAYHRDEKFVVEVEAGRAVTNYQFIKDLFQACVMVDVDYLCIAVRTLYKGRSDFEVVYTFLDTLYSSGRLRLPLKGILIVGY